MGQSLIIARDMEKLLERAIAGAQALVLEVVGLEAEVEAKGAEIAPQTPVGPILLPNEAAIYDTVRAMLGGRLSPDNFALLKAAIEKALLPVPEVQQVGLTLADFKWAAGQLGADLAQVRAVDEVESAGAGFSPSTAAILALDGPGGFIDGENLPKILFEAHKFARHTGGKYNASHPNISSPKWNRALYKGGLREWERLHEAAALDRPAALMSASAGRYQILGENYRLAGFADVESFWAAMQDSERRHLEAFVAFVKNSGLVDELRQVSAVPSQCLPFALGYNGPAAEQNRYPEKIAVAFQKWSKS